MPFFKKYYPFILLAIITIFGLYIRLYNLQANIPQLYADEVGGSYYILDTVKNSPNILSKIYYQTSNFTWIFGLTPAGARASSAIYGTILILAVYFFTQKISSSKTALLTAFLIALTPATFILSRFAATHVIIVAILTCIHAGLFIKAQKPVSYLVSFLPVILAFFYYPSFAVFAPIILSLTFVYALQTANKKQKAILAGSALLLTLIFLAVFILRFKGLSLSSRGIDLAIWRDVNVTATHNLYRGIAGESLPTKLVYNYPLSVAAAFVHNYASFFSPDWLFFTGDPVLRHSTGMVGTLLPVLAPFLIYGAFKFFSSKKIPSKTKTLFLVWILISPIPAALTSDGAGYLLRVITMIPFLLYLSAYGMVQVYNLISSKRLKTFYAFGTALVLIFSAYSFLYGYFKVYPQLTSTAASFEYGFKDLSDFQAQNDNAAMLIIWQGFYPNYYFRFWQQTPFDQHRDFQMNTIETAGAPVYQTFPNLFLTWPKDTESLNIFLSKYQDKIDYIVFPNNYLDKYPQYQPQSDPVKIIKYPNTSKAFSIYKILDK